MKKLILTLLTLSVVGLWAYTPQKTLAEIKSAIAASTTKTITITNKGTVFTLKQHAVNTPPENPTNAKLYQADETNNMYIYSLLTNDSAQNENSLAFLSTDWWFTFTLPNSTTTANVAIDYRFINSDYCEVARTSTDPAIMKRATNTSIYVSYNGTSSDGTVSNIPCLEPSPLQSMPVTLNDGSTGALVYTNFQLTIVAH